MEDGALLNLHSFIPFAGGAAVTAVDVGPPIAAWLNGADKRPAWLVAVGSEAGDISCWVLHCEVGAGAGTAGAGPGPTVAVAVAPMAAAALHVGSQFAHGAAVKRLRWSPGSLLGSGPEGSALGPVLGSRLASAQLESLRLPELRISGIEGHVGETGGTQQIQGAKCNSTLRVVT